MAQDSTTQKPKWGVGSFFQQAVAGVESRLDNILMDEEGNQTNPTGKPTETQIHDTPTTTAPAACMKFVEMSATLRNWLTYPKQFPAVHRAQKEMTASRNVLLEP